MISRENYNPIKDGTKKAFKTIMVAITAVLAFLKSDH